MLAATKLRLYPTAEQARSLEVQFGCARFVWNRALAMKKAAWDERGQSLSCYTIKGMLPEWKAGEYPWLKDADSQALQEVFRHLDRAFGNFFEKRARYPRFKKKHAPPPGHCLPAARETRRQPDLSAEGWLGEGGGAPLDPQRDQDREHLARVDPPVLRFGAERGWPAGGCAAHAVRRRTLSE
jgi:hypothetical protein